MKIVIIGSVVFALLGGAIGYALFLIGEAFDNGDDDE